MTKKPTTTKTRKEKILEYAWLSAVCFILIATIFALSMATTPICDNPPVLQFMQINATAGVPQTHAEYIYNVEVLNGTINDSFTITSYIDNFDYVIFQNLIRPEGTFVTGDNFSIAVFIDYSENITLTENQTIYFDGGLRDGCFLNLFQEPLMGELQFKPEGTPKAFLTWMDPNTPNQRNSRTIYENYKWADENMRYFRKVHFWSVGEKEELK